jgi:hypothetical protein
MKKPVTFYVADDKSRRDLKDLDPDKNPERFGYGVCIWIIQTYLFLKEHMDDVHLASSPPDEGIVVAHANDLPHLTSSANRRRLLICAVRSDKKRKTTRRADIEIVQNKSSANRPGVYFIPHWPQPGLIPRSKNRSQFLNIGYKGHTPEQNQFLNSREWLDFLRQEGINWINDSATFEGRQYRVYNDTKWYDYSNIDAVVALRANLRERYKSKPASKLINCWHAGVPAILGPETPYREIRQSRLDYLEVRSFNQLKNSVLQLKNRPDLRNAMRENGFQRAQAFTVEAIRNRWLEVVRSAQDRYQRQRRWRRLVAVRARFGGGG